MITVYGTKSGKPTQNGCYLLGLYRSTNLEGGEWHSKPSATVQCQPNTFWTLSVLVRVTAVLTEPFSCGIETIGCATVKVCNTAFACIIYLCPSAALTILPESMACVISVTQKPSSRNRTIFPGKNQPSRHQMTKPPWGQRCLFPATEGYKASSW